MDWNRLLTTRRTGQPVDKISHRRTEFQRDYDRIVFSAPFRRMQNKTQVFPLPKGSVFVHNRLTHSIEVASVGRSIGNNLAALYAEEGEVESPFMGEIGSVAAAGCLAHDMGNPPFGHSGERAISHYFENEGGREIIESYHFSEAERDDLVNFDGNANTFRILTHSFNGRREGGFALTYPTVASIIKYPRASVGVKKFGYFQQDREEFESVVDMLGLTARHPLVYVVEAADDICYQVMDIEDACRMGILGYDETRELLMSFYDKQSEGKVFDSLDRVCRRVTDKNEQVSYMRSIVIGKLVECCTRAFWENRESILEGSFDKKSLIGALGPFELAAMEKIREASMARIYRHHSVVEIELSGFKIIGTLLDVFIKSVMEPDRYYSGLLHPFISEQFKVGADASAYDKVLSVVDFVAGMTDVYAVDLFKKIKGMFS